LEDKEEAIFEIDEALGDVLSMISQLQTKGFIKHIENITLKQKLIDVMTPNKFDWLVKSEDLNEYKKNLIYALNVLYELYNKDCIDISLLDERTKRNLSYMAGPGFFERLLKLIS
jgi:hypothetical protein